MLLSYEPLLDFSGAKAVQRDVIISDVCMS